MAVAQWARRCHRVVQAEGSSLGGDAFHLFFSSDFISVLLGLIDFRDIVILCNRPNSCCKQNLKCFDAPLLFSGLFS